MGLSEIVDKRNMLTQHFEKKTDVYGCIAITQYPILISLWSIYEDNDIFHESQVEKTCQTNVADKKLWNALNDI